MNSALETCGMTSNTLNEPMCVSMLLRANSCRMASAMAAELTTTLPCCLMEPMHDRTEEAIDVALEVVRHPHSDQHLLAKLANT